MMRKYTMSLWPPVAVPTQGIQREALDDADKSGRRDLGITLIAVFKFVKALLLFSVALGAVGLVRGGVPHASEQLLSMFSSGTERRARSEFRVQRSLLCSRA
jgi:hypothetical protein